MKLFFFFLIFLSCRCDALLVQGGRPNRRLIKTIKTSHGDIFDCVDIHKQPAFDNPLLKDHQILMQPNVLFEDIKVEEGSNANDHRANIEPEGGGCSDGTVPIHRLPQKNFTESNDDVAKFWAVRSAKRTYYGASSRINVYGVHPVGPNQASAAMIWIANEDALPSELPVIEAGWAVYPGLYNDEKTRLTIAWSRDGSKSMCTNLDCRGFVQTSSKIGLGATLSPLSTYKGTRYYVHLHIYKDDKNNWWFAYDDVKNTVGYWPACLFAGGSGFDHATSVDFGGFVKCRRGEVCPAMGSGAWSYWKSASTMERVQVIGPDHKWGGLGRFKQEKWVTNERCYDVGIYRSHAHAYKFTFGGPPCSNTTVS